VNAVVSSSDAAEDLVLDGGTPFFAPAATDLIATLLAQYDATRAKIDEVTAIFEGDLRSVVGYFIEGNCEDGSRGAPPVERLFQREGAIASLNSTYWARALALTDVYDHMPQARRNEWDTMVRARTCPEFTEQAVRPTLVELLNSRSRYFAERIDGIFQGLSGAHVTNAPEGFGKKMIIAGVITDLSCNHRQVGLIDDLRCVIARFMGRDEPKHRASDSLVRYARAHRGEQITIDGGALRMRVYKVGTAHLEVHPDMAWRLNAMLAHLHPLAIPAEFRQKPRRMPKDVGPMGRPLPFRVVEILATAEQAKDRVEVGFNERWVPVPLAVDFKWYDCDAAALREAESVLESIGGVKARAGRFQFDFNALDAIGEIVVAGVVPDRRAHQFYATNESLGARVAQLAQIRDGATVLEPQAGQGGIVAQLPANARITAVEISPLHCGILRSKFGDRVEVVEADFIVQAEQWWRAGRRFDYIAANPPFADGRARAHTEAAASVLAAGGTLATILPLSMMGSDFLVGCTHEWHGPFANEFAGTSVSVCILIARRT
jgi:hypothetical protein